MKKQLFLLFVILLIINNSDAQTFQNEWTYDSVKSYFRNYAQQKNDTAFDGEMQKYYRFEATMDYKFFKNSKISEYSELVKAFNAQVANSSSSSTLPGSSSFLSNWSCVGPNQVNKTAMGRVMKLWVNPSPPYNIIIGTQASGIWKTKGGQDNPVWTCITENMKACGILDIAVCPTDTNIIYATTSFSGSYTTWYGVGLIYSTNGGETWSDEAAFPSGFFDNAGWNRRFSMPLAFKPGTDILLVGRDTKVWKKHTTPGSEYWETDFVFEMEDVPSDDEFTLNELKFSQNNSNLVVASGVYESEKEAAYSLNGGNKNTWHLFDFEPISGLFEEDNHTILTKQYRISTFIDNQNKIYLLIAVINNYSGGNGQRGYLIRFNRPTGGLYEYDKHWRINPIINDPNNLGHPLSKTSLFNGTNNGLTIIDGATSNDHILIYGQGGNIVLKANFTENTTNPVVLNATSAYSAKLGIQTHADVRDLVYMPTIGSLGSIYIATDGGISVSKNRCSSASDWVSLIGKGLAITENLGFAISEFNKDYMVTTGMDGNSWIHKKVNGVEILELEYGGDEFDASISKIKEHSEKYIKTYNGGGPEDYRLYNFRGIVDLGLSTPFSSTNSTLPNTAFVYNLKQHEFEEKTNYFYTGTTDVYRVENLYLNQNTYHGQSDWKELSYTHTALDARPTTFLKTNWPITSFKSIKNPSNPNIQTSIYGIRYTIQSGDDIRLVKSVFDNSKSILSEKYTQTDITPRTLINGNSILDKTWILDVVVDENNPDRIWVCMGGTTNQFDISGRVYQRDIHTPGNGYEWKDISAGLPNFPILSMVYWKGTDDVIFAGTDVGVYVYNKSLATWERFMSNLPYVTVPELNINYCSGVLRAATFGRGVWETPLPNLGYANTTPKTITSSETWEISMDTYQDVLVKTGATLTIKGTHNSNNTNSVEIRIPKDKRIVVEAGAKLIIDGATITNHCDLWQGIEVYGQKGATQDEINQGRIIVKNGAIIENAKKGITTSKSTESSWDASSTGAIVECENSSFINNLVDIEFLPYHRITTKPLDEKINKSTISKCKFETNDNYLFGTEKPTHIYLWDVNGVKIVGSHFVDNRAITTGSIGIKSIQAGFYVNEYCGGVISLPVASGYTCVGIRSVFENLEYGIQSFSLSNPKYSTNISNSAFNNCSRGVYLSGIDNASVFLNNFNVKRSASTPIYEYSQSRYGVYLDMCKSYKVENNNIEGDVDIEDENSSSSFGIVARNMHGENVTINSNALNKLTIGIEAIGRNRGQTFDKGLQIKCNSFANSRFDISIVNDRETPVASILCGIARYQGYPIPNDANRLAGNLFGNSSPFLNTNYFNEGAMIEYYHHTPPTSNATDNQLRAVPSIYTNSPKIVLRSQSILYSNTTSCPSSFTSLLTPTQLRSHVITQEEILEGNLAALAEMIDGGNTDEFLMALDLNNSSSINTNYFLLMNVAPYLSREVLFKVTEDGNALTNAMLRNILVACAQAAKDEEIQVRLDNRTIPLPQYMRDQINQGLIEISDMENEEREIGSYVEEINHSVNETMWRATQDTVDLSSNIFDIFNDVNDYSLKMQLANWIDADDRKNDANFLIDEIGNNLQTEEDIQNYDIFSDMRNFRYQIADNNLEANKLDQNNIDYLTSYLHYPDVNVSYAMALLKLNNQLSYVEPVLLPQENASRVVNLAPTKIISELDPSESSLEVSPNPVSDLFTAKYKILEKSSNLQLVIADVNGKELFNQRLKHNIDEIIVNCNHFISGNYIVTIKGNGIKSMNQKIVVSKK